MALRPHPSNLPFPGETASKREQEHVDRLREEERQLAHRVSLLPYQRVHPCDAQALRQELADLRETIHGWAERGY